MHHSGMDHSWDSKVSVFPVIRVYPISTHHWLKRLAALENASELKAVRVLLRKFKFLWEQTLFIWPFSSPVASGWWCQQRRWWYVDYCKAEDRTRALCIFSKTSNTKQWMPSVARLIGCKSTLSQAVVHPYSASLGLRSTGLRPRPILLPNLRTEGRTVCNNTGLTAVIQPPV